MFHRYVLRTLDVDAARAFYSEVLDLDFSTLAETSGIEVWPLHEQARARGAPSHWLGHLGTTGVEATMGRLLELGGERLGPTVKSREGVTFAALRDPIGAVIGVREVRDGTPPPAGAPVAWHHLHTIDLERALTIYSEIFGLRPTERTDATNIEGGIRMFRWEASRVNVGSVANTARLPGVHTHWLYYFPVSDIEASFELVRAKGGKVLAPTALPNGHRLAACEDPQGTAFGLFAPR